MRQLLKKITPGILLDYYAGKKYTPKNSKFKGKTTQEIFSEIYEINAWGNDESLSGQGSSVTQAGNAITTVNTIIKRYGIKTLLDLPCGDFNWMNKVDLSGVDYVGGDIVNEMILKNVENYGEDNLRFGVMDLIKDDLPSVDLVIVRDCFVHFSFDDIQRSVNNLKQSGSKYLLTTTFSRLRINHDIITGDWRPLNLRKKPFLFPTPLFGMKETTQPGYERDYRGKSLALWEIQFLPSF